MGRVVRSPSIFEKTLGLGGDHEQRTFADPAAKPAAVSSLAIDHQLALHFGSMARGTTLYRMKMELSDVDRGIYESLDFRVAQHPSEGEDRLVARILAYALLYRDDLEFGKGLSDVDEPALWSRDLTGQILHWIEVGAPSADRIHSASKKAPQVTIVCHKGEEALNREMAKRRVHNAEEISVLHLDPAFVARLAQALDLNAVWTLVHTDGELSVTIGDESFAGSVLRRSLPQPS